MSTVNGRSIAAEASRAIPEPGPAAAARPLALVVFLENVGYIAGRTLPAWLMAAIDFVTEEYAKLILRLYGTYRRYDQVVILEDRHATGPELAAALRQASRTYQVDLLLLVHGRPHSLVGYRDREQVDDRTFDSLLQAYRQDPDVLDLRMVFGLNCYGATLLPVWTELGAQAVNGAVDVNWFPEPTLSLFLRAWLGGRPYSEAVSCSYRLLTRLAGWLQPLDSRGILRSALASSRPVIYGQRDLTIVTRTDDR